MDRREFLKTTGGVAAAAASATVAATAEAESRAPVAAPSVASGRRELVLAMPWADDGKGFGDSARRLARRIERLSEDAWRVEIASSSADADLRHGAAHDDLPLHPAFAYFAGLPGSAGLSAHDLETWLAIGGGQDLWDGLAAEHGMKPLLAGHSGAAPPLWSRAPLRGLEDLAGARVFAMGLGADVARALGAEPVTVSPARLSHALADGEVSVAEWGGLLQSLALGLHTAAPHAVGSGLNGEGTALRLAVALPLWESLTETAKAQLAAAAAEEFRVSLAEARVHEAIVRKAMTEVHGVRFAPFPADVADAVARVSDAMVAHTAGRDERAARIDRSYMGFKSAIAGREAGAIS